MWTCSTSTTQTPFPGCTIVCTKQKSAGYVQSLLSITALAIFNRHYKAQVTILQLWYFIKWKKRQTFISKTNFQNTQDTLRRDAAVHCVWSTVAVVRDEKRTGGGWWCQGTDGHVSPSPLLKIFKFPLLPFLLAQPSLNGCNTHWICKAYSTAQLSIRYHIP